MSETTEGLVPFMRRSMKDGGAESVGEPSDSLLKGAEWLSEQMGKLSGVVPRGFFWRGKPYYPGDRLPKSLRKQLRKVIADMNTDERQTKLRVSKASAFRRHSAELDKLLNQYVLLCAVDAPDRYDFLVRGFGCPFRVVIPPENREEWDRKIGEESDT